MSTVEAILVGYAAQVAATATVSAISSGVKALDQRTAKGRIEIGNLTITAAVEVIRRAGSEIDPVERKRIAFRIERLRKYSDTIPKNLGILEWRRRRVRSKDTWDFLEDCMELYVDASELSESSSLKIWKDVDTQIHNNSAEDLTVVLTEEPTTPRAFDTIISNPSIPPEEPTTPRTADMPACEFTKDTTRHLSTPISRSSHTPTPPPSPSPSTEPLFNPTTPPPASAKPFWRQKNPFVERTSKQKKGFHVELKEAVQKGRS